ncbi:MAG: hypothetical protein KGK44_10805 [Gammaproteobacteria bacterium]|nr:hypothetical protein [Gammaproteobacteria bacterium]
MRKITIAALCMALCACAEYPPGEDPGGLQLQAAATPVMQAIQKFMAENSSLPRTLQELVPEYIKQLPPEPKLVYDPQDNAVLFTYTQQGSNGSTVTCTAYIGQTNWTCQ